MAGIQHDDAPELRRRGRRRRDSRDRELEPWSAFPTKCGGVRYMAGYIKGKELPQTSGISGRICFDVFFPSCSQELFFVDAFFRFFLIMVPTLGWFRKGNRIQTDDLGTTPFWETSEYVVPHFAAQFVSDGGCEMATHYTFQEWAEGCRRENL